MNIAEKMTAQTRNPARGGTRLRVVDTSRLGESSRNSLEVGRVLGVEDTKEGGEARFQVRLANAAISARRAAGCLVAPEAGDKVLLLREGEAGFHILNVLEKKHAASTLNFPGELRINAPAVDIQGTQRVGLRGAEMDLRGVDGKVSFLRLDLAAGECRVQAKTLRTTVASLVQRAARCLRIVGEERLKARRVKTQVRGRWSLDAEDAELVAEKDVKVDGEHILLG